VADNDHISTRSLRRTSPRGREGHESSAKVSSVPKACGEIFIYRSHPRSTRPNDWPAASDAVTPANAIVIDGSRDPIASRRLDDLVAKASLTIEPATAEQAHIARAAYRDFGTGSGHPARRNFGVCFAYALAKATEERLLFKGEDFGSTDIRPYR
jgi:ribonuclease VapC